MTVGIFVSSLALSFRQSMRAYIGQFLAADLTVSAVATEGGWLETPLPEALAGELRAIDGVAGVEMISVLPGQPYAGMRIGIAGMSAGFFDVDRYPSNWFREGDPAEASAAIRRGEGANISTGLADRTGLHAGDSITLETPTGPLTLPIVGVVPDYISDKGSVLILRRLVQEHWLVDTVHRFQLFLAPSTPLERVRKAIASVIGTRHKIKILSLREVLAYHDNKIDTAFSFTAAIQLLVIIVTVAGIFDLLVSAIIERRRELAVLQLIGAERALIRNSIVIESAVIGILGGVLGTAVGLVTAWIWIHFNFRFLLGYYLEEHFALNTVFWYAILIVTATVITGYATARRTLAAEIITSLRDE